jgi:hypothetical protein
LIFNMKISPLAITIHTLPLKQRYLSDSRENGFI